MTRMTADAYRAQHGPKTPPPTQVLGRSVRGAPKYTTEYSVRLPFLPPSTNHLYVTVGKKRFPNPKLRPLHKLAAQLIRGRLDPALLYALSIAIHCPCFNKGNGKVKKLDASNRIKALEDWLAKGLGVDDSRFFTVTVSKFDSPDAWTDVRITALDAVKERV